MRTLLDPFMRSGPVRVFSDSHWSAAVRDTNTVSGVVGVDGSEMQAGDCSVPIMIRRGEAHERPCIICTLLLWHLFSCPELGAHAF